MKKKLIENALSFSTHLSRPTGTRLTINDERQCLSLAGRYAAAARDIESS